ncbi:Protein ECM25 [Candida viswanathii]|uniref:Protein ECM25 n=1 Tax=Candida viswanathii TaxID=5486 RepID=A0A367YE11_9ASCO|nr:Protein ECM25 [Candida viswanathii]
MDRIFYKTDLRDPTTNYPIYIFDTSYLPSPELINYNEFLPIMMGCLPVKPYVLIMFSCGLNKISWMWGVKFLKSFLTSNNERDLKNLVKIFTVHDSWFIKSISSILYNFNSTRKNLQQLDRLLEAFAMENELMMLDATSRGEQGHTMVIHCKTLSELSHYMDITHLKISLNVYRHDIQIAELTLSMMYQPILNPLVTLDINQHAIFHHHLYQIFKIVETNCNKVELIFYKPGNKLKCDILYQCILRNQLIWINDWDLYSIATVFKRILMELPFPLIDINWISLPMQDDLKYTLNTLKRVTTNLNGSPETVHYDQLLLQILDMLHKTTTSNETTKHTSVTISKSMSHSLSHEVVSNNTTHIQIINRFLKNLLEYWHDIRPHFKVYSIDDTISGKLEQESKTSPRKIKLHDTSSYDLSHDITLDQESETTTEEEETESIETTNVLLNLKLNETPTTPKPQPMPKPQPSLHQRTKSEYSMPRPAHKKTLSDVSNVLIQFPPQKYKFSNVSKKTERLGASPSTPTRVSSGTGTPGGAMTTTTTTTTITTPLKKPVIRGRKVSQLAKLFEERSEAIGILESMS